MNGNKMIFPPPVDLRPDGGRLPAAAQKTTTLTTASVQVIGPSEKRRGILFFPPSWGRCWLNMDIPAAVGVGIALDSDSQPLMLTAEVHGDMVRRAWNAVHTGTDIGTRPWPTTSRGSANASAANATADAAVTPSGTDCVVIEGIATLYNPATIGTGSILFGATTVYTEALPTQQLMLLTRPLVAPPGVVVHAQLSTGGAGVNGWVVVFYSTIAAPSITTYEILGP